LYVQRTWSRGASSENGGGSGGGGGSDSGCGSGASGASSSFTLKKGVSIQPLEVRHPGKDTIQGGIMEGNEK